jgi:hypothetical protein
MQSVAATDNQPDPFDVYENDMNEANVTATKDKGELKDPSSELDTGRSLASTEQRQVR